MQTALPPTRRRHVLAGYLAMLAATGLVYLWIRTRGSELAAPSSGVAPGAGAVSAEHSTVLAHFLLALAVITVLARFFGGFFRRYLNQPPVIGEIVAGLALGPSVLGALSPEAYEFLLPASTAPLLSVISKVGVVLFMFLVGLDLDLKFLRGQTHTAIAISHASIIVPFLLGAGLALSMYPVYSNHEVSFTVFSLFLGVSMSVTAFPVLARILVDRRVQHTPLGTAALACAAVGDATAWTMLAFVAAVASSQVGDAAWTVAFVLVYVAAMLLIVKPLARRFVEREQRAEGPLSHTAFAVVLISDHDPVAPFAPATDAVTST